MVKVYFEDKEYDNQSELIYLELVAVFSTEELYLLCLPHIEVQASLSNMTVLKLIEDGDIVDKF